MISYGPVAAIALLNDRAICHQRKALGGPMRTWDNEISGRSYALSTKGARTPIKFLIPSTRMFSHIPRRAC